MNIDYHKVLKSLLTNQYTIDDEAKADFKQLLTSLIPMKDNQALNITIEEVMIGCLTQLSLERKDEKFTNQINEIIKT